MTSRGTVCDGAMQQFLQWLSDNGTKMDGLEFRQCLKHAGYGVFATRPFAKDEQLCDVPSVLLMTDEIAEAADTGKALRDLNPAVPDCMPLSRLCLVLFLMHEKSKGKESKWFPFIEVIPAEHDDVLWWCERDIEMVKGSNLYYTAKKRREDIHSCYEMAVQPLLQMNPTLFPSAVYSWEKFMWAVSAISSRGFPYHYSNDKATLGPNPAEGKAREMLVPLLDMFNHRPREPITWNTSDTAVGFCSGRAIANGDEVYNNYGARTNEELILTYGFCYPENPDDKFPLCPCLTDDDTRATRQRLIAAAALDFTDATLTKEGPSKELIGIVRCGCMTQMELMSRIPFDETMPCFGTCSHEQATTLLLSDSALGLRCEVESWLTIQKLIVDRTAVVPAVPLSMESSQCSSVYRCLSSYIQGIRELLDICKILVTRALSEKCALSRITHAPEPSLTIDRSSNCPDLLMDYAVSSQPTQYGAICTQSVDAGRILFSSETVSTPIMSAKMAMQLMPEFNDIVDEIDLEDDEDTVLVLAILYSTMHTSSPWYNYVKSLPKAWPVPLYASGEDRGKLCSDVLAQTQQHMLQLHELYTSLMPSISRSYPDAFPSASSGWDDFLWAATAMTYLSHDVQVASSSTSSTTATTATTMTCIIPQMPLPRHHPVPNAVLSCSQDQLQVTAITTLAPGDEIFLSYSRNMSASEMLVQRGTIPACLQYEGIALDWKSAFEAALGKKMKTKHINALIAKGIEHGMFVSRMWGLGQGSVLQTAAILSSFKHHASLHDLLAAALDIASSNSNNDNNNERSNASSSVVQLSNRIAANRQEILDKALQSLESTAVLKKKSGREGDKNSKSKSKKRKNK